METSTETLLAELSTRGISLRVEGDRLRYTAPPGAVSPELLALLKTRKMELIAFLREGQKLLPPSFAQKRFWTLQRLNPADSFYNSPHAFRLSGPLDSALLRQAFDTIIERHESLRTTLQEVNGALMQSVAPTGHVNLSEVEAASGELQGFLLRECQRPFDLAQEPGFRVLLVKTGPQEYVLQLCLHNTLYDRASLLVLLKELSVHYQALLSGKPAALPLPAQYSEYVRWQESLLNTGMEDRLAYWSNWFAAGEPPKWAWTPAEPSPQQPSFQSRVTWQRWGPQETAKLKAFSQRHGATTYIALIAGLASTLRQYTGCSDITIGTTYSNRHDWQFDTLIGATIDVPALRIDMSDGPDISVLLKRVRSVVAEALTYQDVPAERVLARQPGALFRSVLSYFPDTPDGSSLELPGIRAEFLQEVINGVSRPDLYLMLCEKRDSGGDSLVACWLHKQNVFSPETAARMTRDFHAFLDLTLC